MRIDILIVGVIFLVVGAYFLISGCSTMVEVLSMDLLLATVSFQVGLYLFIGAGIAILIGVILSIFGGLAKEK